MTSAPSAASQITDSTISSVSASLTTSATPAAVVWAVDGKIQGNATGGGTAWSFSWPISSLDDGTYDVSAWTVDANGNQGAATALTIKLNRYAPRAPTGFNAGRNGSVIDFEWIPNTEKDIVGYRVYRTNTGGPDVQVCGLQTPVTNCIDNTPPAGSPISYYAVGYDLDPSGNAREGAHSATANVTTTNLPANPPTNLQLSVSGGSTTLTWTAPSVADADGDPVSFYRIYRDGSSYAYRYGRTTKLTFTDAATGGTTHTYYITTVDPQLAESTIVGPVSG
jgi:hypothetical protein